jgi:hypothetical protein
MAPLPGPFVTRDAPETLAQRATRADRVGRASNRLRCGVALRFGEGYSGRVLGSGWPGTTWGGARA